MTKAQKTNLDNLPTGTIRYTMKNDYMFRAVLQKNENALKGLLYALLSLPDGSITSVVILNPIVLGETIDDKTCVLDIQIRLNNDQLINIEMQVNDLGDWPERSLTYLCRSFDHLQKGQGYIDVHTTIHIGILDFNLPNLTPEFYSEYKMTNTKNHEVYSDKFVLRVLNLQLVENNALREEYGDLYDWATLFKATEWEELQMLAEKNSYIKDTIVTLHQMTDDEKIREQCRGREKYNWDMASAIEKGRREGHAQGLTEGLAQGLTEGLAQGETRLSSLINLLLEKGLTNEIRKVTTDSAYREVLYKKYQL